MRDIKSLFFFYKKNFVVAFFAAGMSSFALQPTSIVVTEGSVARFSCKISAHPPPIITWEFNRVTLPLSTERYKTFLVCCLLIFLFVADRFVWSKIWTFSCIMVRLVVTVHLFYIFNQNHSPAQWCSSDPRGATRGRRTLSLHRHQHRQSQTKHRGHPHCHPMCVKHLFLHL